MNTEEYWKDRAEQRESKWFNKSENQLEKELQVAYSRSLIKIQKETNAMYAKYAESNGLSLAQAKKNIKGNEYKVWRMDIEEYVKNINSSQDKKLLRELNTLAMRSRISRLDKIYGETLMQLNTLTNSYENKLTKFLSNAFQDNYYHNLYDLNKATGIVLPVGKLDPLMIKSILNRPWSGKNYSSLIWDNTSQLAKVLKTEITNGMIRGINSAEMSRVIATKFGGSYSNAVRLVRTELSYINNQAALESIKDAGGEWYRFIATLDKRTSKDCREWDGKKIEIKDASPGSNMPPMHPRCRSTIAIDFPDLKRMGQRFARDEKGEYISVPANMNYEEWKKVYIDKTTTLEDLKISDKNDIIKANIIHRHSKILSSEHQQELSEYLNHMNERELHLYDKMSDKFSNSQYYKPKTGWYSPLKRKIEMDMKDNEWEKSVGINKKGAWNTKFHEEFHQLDHLLANIKLKGVNTAMRLTSPLNPIGEQMSKAILSDVLDVVNMSIRAHNHIKEDNMKPLSDLGRIPKKVQTVFFDWLKTNYNTKAEKAQILMFTDAMGLATKGRLSPHTNGFWGHNKKYNETRALAGATSETWANYGAVKLQQHKETEEVLRKIMPSTFSVFDNIYEDLLIYIEKNTLSY